VFLHSGWLGEAIAIPFVIGAEAPKHTFWAWWWSCLNLIPTCGQVPFRAFAKGAEFQHLVLHYAWHILYGEFEFIIEDSRLLFLLDGSGLYLIL
jgi:hypothetical protein